jgi:NAD+ diphosphatase
MRDFRFCPRCAAPLTVTSADHENRPSCSAGCGFVLYDNPVPVVAAVVEHDGLVVLARNRAWPETWYALVAGFLERGETAEQGVLREVQEELGLSPSQATLIGVYPFHRMNQVIIAYHVVASGTITLNDELVDYRRIELGKCRAWTAGTGLALRDFLRARGFEPEMTELPG